MPGTSRRGRRLMGFTRRRTTGRRHWIPRRRRRANYGRARDAGRGSTVSARTPRRGYGSRRLVPGLFVPTISLRSRTRNTGGGRARTRAHKLAGYGRVKLVRGRAHTDANSRTRGPAAVVV